MAFTAAQLTAIETALATGELTVSFEGKHVTYRSVEELIAARDLIRAELIAAGTLPAETRVSYGAYARD